MKLKIEISLKGADIEGDSGNAVRRILESLARDLGHASSLQGLQRFAPELLRDLNDNIVGAVRFTR